MELTASAELGEQMTQSQMSQGTKDRHTDFMFRRAKNRQIYKSLLQETVAESIKQKCNQRKMSSNSYKLMLKRLENSLTLILSDIDRENLRQVSFEQLGRMFFLLGIFRII